MVYAVWAQSTTRYRFLQPRRSINVAGIIVPSPSSMFPSILDESVISPWLTTTYSILPRCDTPVLLVTAFKSLMATTVGLTFITCMLLFVLPLT